MASSCSCSLALGNSFAESDVHSRADSLTLHLNLSAWDDRTMWTVGAYGPIQFAIMAERKNRPVLLSPCLVECLPERGQIAVPPNFGNIRADLSLETVVLPRSDLSGSFYGGGFIRLAESY
jgi:hypothetical protein